MKKGVENKIRKYLIKSYTGKNRKSNSKSNSKSKRLWHMWLFDGNQYLFTYFIYLRSVFLLDIDLVQKSRFWYNEICFFIQFVKTVHKFMIEVIKF